MRKLITGIPAVFFLFLIQISVLRGLALSGAVPNLLLILCCSYAYMRGQRSGIWIGFFSGLLLDIFLMDGLGTYAMLYLYIGFLAGLTHPWYEARGFKLPLLCVFVGDIALSLVQYLIFYVLRGDFRFGVYLTGRLLPELLATMLASVAVYPLLLWIEERFVNIEADEKKKQAEYDMAALAESGERRED